MEDLSLHILDIAENSINAGAKNIEIVITDSLSNDLLTIEIKDDGKGIDAEAQQKVMDPFYTTRTTRKVGLGLALLEEAAKDADGQLKLESELGKGTKVYAVFRLSHIDRKPIGNIVDTIVTIIAGNPELNLKFIYKQDDNKFVFDTTEIKNRIGDLEINSIEIIKFIHQYLSENVNKLL
ncbi:MAG: ATP-binding protein [Bacteroidetes bacterium]|nr:ATP-binding protein [Bacteroidota bacterium]MBU1422934.1 ATP-binding protein [Bacteroidota bacterium]MBU2636224.1 ATP-binding protein [Bacteroidota bacterium]